MNLFFILCDVLADTLKAGLSLVELIKSSWRRMEWLMSGGKAQKWAQTKPKVMQDVKMTTSSVFSDSFSCQGNIETWWNSVNLICYQDFACKIVLKTELTQTVCQSLKVHLLVTEVHIILNKATFSITCTRFSPDEPVCDNLSLF